MYVQVKCMAGTAVLRGSQNQGRAARQVNLHALIPAVHGDLLPRIVATLLDQAGAGEFGGVGVEDQLVVAAVWDRDAQVGVGFARMEIEGEDERPAAVDQ